MDLSTPISCRILGLLLLCFNSALAVPTDKKLVVIGSSVPRGFGAYTTGSYLGDDVDRNGSADSFASSGYAGRIKSYIEARGWTFDNQSIAGDATSDVLARFATDLVPENPEIVLIGLSLGNEGLTFTSEPDRVFESFESGLLQIIQNCRDEGYYPIIGLVYPNDYYTVRKYGYVKRMNLLINTWDVPSINLLGAIDDGAGRWAEGFIYDSGHPNVPGHEEMYHAVVPSLFDAIDQGKTSVPTYPVENGFVRLSQDSLQAAPLTYTPNETVRAFTTNFKVRSTNVGTVAAVRLAAEPLFLVDFGPSDDVNGRATSGVDAFGNYWNSWRPASGGATISAGETLSNIVTVGNTASTVSLEVTDAFSGSNGILGGGLDVSDGPDSALLGTLAVETATEDYFYETGTAAFKLTGLDPVKRYTFRFFASRQSSIDRQTRYTVSGGMSYSPYAFLTTSGADIGSNRNYAGNDDSIVVLSGITPTAGGEVTVTVTPEVGDFSYLSVMEVLVDATGAGSRFATVEVREDAFAYVAADGRELVVPMDANDGSWYELALSHRYAQQETLLYIDGQLAGGLRESIEPDQFILGGSGSNGSESPLTSDYQDWAVYRAAWTADEALAQHAGLLQQASLEICTALADSSFSNGAAVDNRAQSLSTAVINTANVSAPMVLSPPSALTALSQASDAVELSWIDNSSSESAVTLERRALLEGELWTTVATLPADTIGTIDAGLGKGIGYEYRVSTVESVRHSGYSNVVAVNVGEDGRSYHAWISDYYDVAPAEYRIDFNTLSSPSYGTEIWNTVNSLAAGAVYPLVDANNDATAGYTVRLTNGFDQFRSGNGNPLAGYDDDPQQTLFVSNETEPGGAVIVLSGLDPALHYDLSLFARRGTVVSGFEYAARYTIAGAASDLSYESDNALSAEAVEVYSVRPDASGSITIQIDPTDTPAGAFFAGISFLVLKEVNQPCLIDFNAEADPLYPSTETWNTISSVSSTTPYALLDASGSASAGVTLTLSSPFSASRSGDGPAVEGGVVDTAAESNLFALTGGSPMPAELRIGGLDTSRSYEVALLAKRNSNTGGFDYSGIYTVTGAGTPEVRTVDAADNSEYTVVSAVVPNGSGEIVIQVAANDDIATVTNEFPVLNLLRIAIDGAASGYLPAFEGADDSDSDGADNFVEYALGRDPTSDDSTPITFDSFTVDASGNAAVFEYSRARVAQDVYFVIQHTVDLSNPDWQPVVASTESVVGMSGAMDTLEVRAPLTGGAEFFRLSLQY